MSRGIIKNSSITSINRGIPGPRTYSQQSLLTSAGVGIAAAKYSPKTEMRNVEGRASIFDANDALFKS